MNFEKLRQGWPKNLRSCHTQKQSERTVQDFSLSLTAGPSWGRLQSCCPAAPTASGRLPQGQL